MIQSNVFKSKFNNLIILTILGLLALYLRWPFVGSGLPFFYDEDEGHHFNRVVNMVKQGEFNPNYFHKPSLHFYLRMPAVAAGFLWNVRQGHIRSVQEIRTHDRYGLGGYAFTASHPGIVKSVRVVSLLLSLALVFFTFLLCLEYCSSPALSVFAALAVAFNPELVKFSAQIGVDVLMAVMCVVSVWLSLRYLRVGTVKLLVLASLFAGLAVSSKYNALPIVLTPLIAVLARRETCLNGLLISAAAVTSGFILGTPFALGSLPLFLDQVAYEIYHYGVAGHVGHSAEPGAAQAWFYLKWFLREGAGVIFFVGGLLGVVWLALQRSSKALVLLSFPVLFSGLMISQRANFTRNMMVLIPFILVCGLLGGDQFLSRIKLKQGAKPLLIILVLFFAFLQPLALTMGARAKALDVHDSRSQLAAWLVDNQQPLLDTVIAGELQLPPALYKLNGVSVVGEGDLGLNELYQSGAGRLIVPGWYSPALQDSRLVTVEKLIAGDLERKRIVSDPAIDVLRFRQTEEMVDLAFDSMQREAAQQVVQLKILPLNSDGYSCAVSAEQINDPQSENYCWLQGRVGYLEFYRAELLSYLQGKEQLALRFKLMSPWLAQSMVLKSGDWEKALRFNDAEVGKWQLFDLEIPKQVLVTDPKLFFHLDQVHSPRGWEISKDDRRLGIAVEVAKVLN